MMEEVARPVQAAQLSHCMNAEMLAADPPVIWSIPSGTALAMNAPRNQQLGISMINPRRACAARVTVVGSVCPSVCLCVRYFRSAFTNEQSCYKQTCILSGI